MGITEEYWYGDGKLTIRRLQDVEGVLDLNKQHYNSHGNVGYGDSDGLHKVARVPLVLIEKWLREEGFDWFNSTDAERRARLNANPKLLVRPGKL